MTPPDVLAPNFKFRLSGVTTTLERAVAAQRAQGVDVLAAGPGLSPQTPRYPLSGLWRLWRKPEGKPFRIWHARRNVEMLAGVVLRDALRMPIRLVFTSAAQRRHTGWTRFLIGRMDRVIATTARSASYLERSSIVIPHGIALEDYRPSQDRPEDRRVLGLPGLRLAGCFGRIRAQKGTDLFVEALIRLLPARPDWGAVVSGRATSEHQGFLKDLQERVAAAGLSERVIFTGETPGELMPRLFRAMDLYVAPQRWEGFGVTPLEAMASGVPVVATDVGAFSELLCPETGTLIKPDDLEAMTAAMGRWMDDAQGRTAAAAAARTRALERFDIAREAAAINAVYEDLWKAKRR